MANPRYILSYVDKNKLHIRQAMQFATLKEAKAYAELLTAIDRPKLVDTVSDKEVDFVLHGRYRVSYYKSDYSFVRQDFDTVEEARAFAADKLQPYILDIVNDEYVH